MDGSLIGIIGIVASFGLSAIGAGIGMAANRPAVIGAWKKCHVQKKPAPFILIVFASTCLTNVIYGFITMMSLTPEIAAGSDLAASLVALGPEELYRRGVMGIVAGICIGIVAITQAMCSAAAADAYAETGQGFGNHLMVVGVAETISLFAMVFAIM